MEQPDGGPSGFFPAGFEPVTHQDMSADNRQLFFAKISKNAGEDEIKLLFSEYGTVLDVILFQSSQGSGTSKGCGLVTMSTHEEAAAAIAALHGKFAWSNRDPAMVVTWMDVALQDPARLHNIQSGRTGPKPLGLSRGTARPLELVADGADTPPVGCDPDAVKLFVGNIPLSYTEEQLLPLFQQIGPVVELVVVRNKLNSLSKGCAFVWYASREHAETAITALNLQHMLPDVTGQQHRPLVVRKARTGHMLGGLVQKTSADDLRLGGAALGGSGPLRAGLPNRLLGGHTLAAPPLSHPLLSNRAMNTNPYLGQASVMNPNAQLINPRYGMAAAPMLTTQNAPVHFNMRPAGLHPQQLHAQSHMLGSGGGYATVGHYHGGMQIGHQPLELLHQGQPITVHTLPNGTKYVQTASAGPQPQYQVVGPSQHHQPQYQYILDTGAQQQTHIQHLGLSPDLLEQYMPMQAVQAVQMPGMDSGATQSHGTVMALDTSQLALVNDHLFSIQSSSSCALMVSPGGPGTFNLLLSGERQQVERAQLMVASLLSQDAGSKGALS